MDTGFTHLLVAWFDQQVPGLDWCIGGSGNSPLYSAVKPFLNLGYYSSKKKVLKLISVNSLADRYAEGYGIKWKIIITNKI